MHTIDAIISGFLFVHTDSIGKLDDAKEDWKELKSRKMKRENAQETCHFLPQSLSKFEQCV